MVMTIRSVCGVAIRFATRGVSPLRFFALYAKNRNGFDRWEWGDRWHVGCNEGNQGRQDRMTNEARIDVESPSAGIEPCQGASDGKSLVRLYCWLSRTAWNLQIFAPRRLKNGHKGPDWAATVSLERAQLVALRDAIEFALAEK